jgi:hypothetical protein
MKIRHTPWLLTLALAFILQAGSYSQTSGISGLVDKLFQILEARHREILSIEENITHNRSDLEKESLLHILRQKVQGFRRKDQQVYGVLEQIKDSQDQNKALLYEQSMHRLGEFRANIDQIQELYFKTEISPAPEIQVQSGGSDFQSFLNTWESKAPVQNYEKRTTHARIPTAQKKYYEHIRKQDRKQDRKIRQKGGSYEGFLAELSPRLDKKQRTLPSQDMPAIDKYHQRLKKESRSMVRIRANDKSFAHFYQTLEEGYKDDPAEVRSQKSTLQDTGSPFHISGNPNTSLDTPGPEKHPLDLLIQDLDTLRENQQGLEPEKRKTVTERSFSKFYDQLELSRSQKEARLHQTSGSRSLAEEMDRFKTQSRRASTREGRQSFSDLQAALSSPKTQKSVIIESRPSPTVASQSKQGFKDFLNAIPPSLAQAGVVPAVSPIKGATPGPSNWIGSETRESPSARPSHDRFRSILNSLKKENRIAMVQSEFVDPDEKRFEQDLQSIFPERRITSRKPKTMIIKSAGPQFENFPETSLSDDKKSPLPLLGTRDSSLPRLNQSYPVVSSSQPVSESPIAQDPATPSGEAPVKARVSRKNATLGKPTPQVAEGKSKPRGPAGQGSIQSAVATTSIHESFEGDVPKPSQRAAAQAQARLLRRGATLIPVQIEARDIKDRLYPDLPISFEVELKPRNFLAGHILDSSQDTPWKKTVQTSSTGTAKIHLLLNLKDHEVNISRKILTTKETTICKILLTPRI